MTRIVAYVLRQHFGPFLLGFGVVTFLLTTDFLLDYLDMLINKGIPAWVVGQLFLFALGWMIALSIPCGVLVSVLMAFGRMAQDNEITALRASGVNPARVLTGPLIAATLLAAGLAYFNDRILPETNHRYANLLLDIGRKRPAVEVREGVLNTDVEGYALLAGSVDAETGELRNVVVLQAPRFGESTGPVTACARRGRLAYSHQGTVLSLSLFDGELHDGLGDDPRAYRRLAFTRQTINIQGMNTELLRSQRQSRGDREMTTEGMLEEVRRTEVERGASLHRVETAARQLGYPGAAAALRSLAPARRGWRALFGGAARVSPAPAPSPTPPGVTLSGGAAQARQTLDIARAEMESQERRIDSLRVEIHKKYAIPCACIVFVLLGAPLGMRARRGGVLIGFASVGFFVLYYLFLIGGENLADRDLLSPVVAMWGANVVLGGVGLLLTLRACDIRLWPVRRRRVRAAQ